jgi:hypothetical protein
MLIKLSAKEPITCSQKRDNCISHEEDQIFTHATVPVVIPRLRADKAKQNDTQYY